MTPHHVGKKTCHNLAVMMMISVIPLLFWAPPN